MMQPAPSVIPSATDIDLAQRALPTLSQIRHFKQDGYLGLVFDLDHALALDAEFQALNDAKDPAPHQDDDDFPQDLQDQKALVQLLYEAIDDHTTSVDKKISPRREWKSSEGEEVLIDNPQVARVKAAPNVDNEVLCWRLLVRTTALYLQARKWMN